MTQVDVLARHNVKCTPSKEFLLHAVIFIFELGDPANMKIDLIKLLSNVVKKLDKPFF